MLGFLSDQKLVCFPSFITNILLPFASIPGNGIFSVLLCFNLLSERGLSAWPRESRVIITGNGLCPANFTDKHVSPGHCARGGDVSFTKSIKCIRGITEPAGLIDEIKTAKFRAISHIRHLRWPVGYGSVSWSGTGAPGRGFIGRQQD